MNGSCGTLNQLQTRDQLICDVEIHRFHVVANRIHLPDIVFSDLNGIIDQSPEYRNFHGQIGAEVCANGLNSKLGADALNPVLLAALKTFTIDMSFVEGFTRWKSPLTGSSISVQSSRDTSMIGGRPGPRSTDPLLLVGASLALLCNDSVSTPWYGFVRSAAASAILYSRMVFGVKICATEKVKFLISDESMLRGQ